MSVQVDDRAGVSETIQEIRNSATDYLEGKTKRFRPHRTMLRLKPLKTFPPTADFLEASILVWVAGRRRPSRTVGLMKLLSSIREEQGEPQKFKEFSDRICRYLYPARLTSHGYTESYFSNFDNQTALNHIAELLLRFEELNYEVILNSGTLLGVVRDGRLIDHDDDIDLAVVLKATNRKEAAQEWVNLYDTLKGLNLLQRGNNRQNEIYKLNPVGDVSVDLFPCWIAGGKVYLYPHTHGELRKRDLLPTQTCPVTGYPIPANPVSFLEVNYGEAWTKPDPYFVFPWRKQKKIFHNFIEEVQNYINSKKIGPNFL